MSPVRKTKKKNRKPRKTYCGKFEYLAAKVGWMNLSLVAILVIGIFGYIIQGTAATTKGFQVSNLQGEVVEYEEIVRSLEQNINDLKSVEYISRVAEELEMIAVNDIEFLSPLSSGVALRK